MQFYSKSQQVILLISTNQLYVCLVTSDFLRPHVLFPARFHGSWTSPGKNTGVGCHAFLQEIFLTLGSNLCLFCLLHCKGFLYFKATIGRGKMISASVMLKENNKVEELTFPKFQTTVKLQ